jgi:hypothetical protein
VSTLLTCYLGKTNQHGRIEYGATLRHRDHRSCVIEALAVFFFWRWTHSGEPFPLFRTSQDWYMKKVLKRDVDYLDLPLSKITASVWTLRIYYYSHCCHDEVTNIPLPLLP